jgi:putative tryptophan/tyrosine transport system substrate-binding protein
MMKPKISWLLLAILLLATVPFTEAQQPGKVSWIGYLTGSSSAPNQAFLQGMRDLGYVEGKNIGFLFRTAEGDLDRLPGLAAELVRLKVNVIVAASTPATLAAKNATKEIPILFETIGVWYSSHASNG